MLIRPGDAEGGRYGSGLVWEKKLHLARFRGPVWITGRPGVIHDRERIFVGSQQLPEGNY